MTALRIGIPVIGGPHWMAGVTYVEMLARSAQYIDPSRRPELHLVADPASLPHVELHLPFLSLFKGILLLLPPGMDAGPFRSSVLTICMGREELFRNIDFYYPVIGDAWEQCAASWIPDFQHRLLPDFFSAEERAQRDAAFGRVARQAGTVVLSSERVKRDFERFYPESTARTHVLRFFSFTGSPLPGDARETARKYGLPERYLLCCNQFWMHKDHATLFKAIARLRQSGADVPVVCTGSTSDYRSSGYFDSLRGLLDSLGIADRVTILGMIPREDQIQIIRRSCALVQPSLFEGWSSIVEDAKSLGKTIFLSDLDVHKEQAPSDGRFFKAGDPASLAQALANGFPSLSPGPDLRGEAQARSELDGRMLAFGEAFLAMAESTVRSFSGPPPSAEPISRTSRDPAPPAPSATSVAPPSAVPSPAAPASSSLAADLDRAEQAYREGRPEDAESLALDALKENPADARALNTLGVVQYATGRKDKARRSFLEAIKADPGYADACLNLADSLEEADLHAEALGLCYRYLDQRPDHDAMLARAASLEEALADRLLSKSLIRDLNYVKKPYRVTALVSTYKSEAFMQECLEDLEGQTMAADLEIVVVDAASPEGEGAIVEAFQRRYTNIRYIRTPERIGIYPAWNLAVRASSGAFLTPFSTNDRLNPEAYAILHKALLDDPDAVLVYGDSHLTDHPHQAWGRHIPSSSDNGVFQWPDYDFEDLMTYCRVGPHPMWRREAHRQVGYFDGRYRAIGDQDFWLRLGIKHKLLHIPVFTGIAWITKDSLSGDQAAVNEIVGIHAKHTKAYLIRLRTRLMGKAEKAASPEEGVAARASAPEAVGLRGPVAEEAGRGSRIKVTAIVSTYKSERFMRGVLVDLTGQTLFRSGAMEIVVVDSGSPENEGAIVETFIAAHPDTVRYFRTERETLYAAWNRAVKLSRGRYLVAANTDDRHAPDAFERMADALDRTPVGLVYTDALLTSGENETFARNGATRVWKLPDFSIRQALADCPFGCLVMWRKELHDKVGDFDPTFRIAGDYEFFLRAALASGARHLDQALCLYFESSKNLSYGDQDAVNREVNSFLPRYRRDVPLAAIYPFLHSDSSPAALAAARVDLASLFLHPLARVGAAEAEHHLRAAQAAVGKAPEISGNLFVALVEQQRFEEAKDILVDLECNHPQHAARIVADLGAKPPVRTLFRLAHPGLTALAPVAFAEHARLPLTAYPGLAGKEGVHA
jgi:glycosyltransferase involved in cell wall biosynthesis